MAKSYYILILFLINIVCCAIASSQTENEKLLSENPTQLKQYVVDETATLTPPQVMGLIKKLQNEDKTTSNQIVVYMIPSLNGESLEDVSIRLAERNKIGKKDKNNGVLLLVVKNDRKIRIEVGYGLEGALTDATSSSIIRNVITPEFKKGNYFEGIDKGVDAIISAIKGEYKSDDNSDFQNISCCFGIPLFVIIIFGLIFFFIFISIIKNIAGVGRTLRGGKSGWSSGGWGGFGGGSGSSWGGGSSSGGGGFSGGGGSFGGGGASGSW